MMIAHVFHCLLTTFLYGGRKLCVKKQTDASDHQPPPLSSFTVSYLVFPKHMLEDNLVGKVGCHRWSALSPKIRNLADLHCPACHWESLPMKGYQISTSELEYNPVGGFHGEIPCFPPKICPRGERSQQGELEEPPQGKSS